MHEYRYELCLYKSANQQKRLSGSRSAAVSLGTRWAWQHRAAHGDGGAPIVGVLSGGARCAEARVDRSLIVTFVCGTSSEELGKISERSTCVYEVTLTTPAACE